VSTAAAAVIAAIVGALLGSFLNVVIWRLPRGESLVKPGSHCPHCGAPVKPYDNIPVLSWLILRGRCRSCGERISVRYPLVEALTAALMAAAAVRAGADRDIWIAEAFVLTLIPLTFIDLDTRTLPNKITYPSAVLGLVLVAALRTHDLPKSLIWGAAAFLFLFVALLAYPGGMGMGDVKLAGVMGLVLGRAVAPAMFVALLAGTVVGAIVIARKGVREGRKTRVPFGPFLALGSLVGLFAGDALVNLYVHGVGL
jgi:leader peptidase (prepilin peptidase)/N-methyltransferase